MQSANHKPYQFMQCKQTIRSNIALQVLSPTIPLLIGKLISHTILHATKWCNINATTTAAELAVAAAEAEKMPKFKKSKQKRNADGFLDFHSNDSLFQLGLNSSSHSTFAICSTETYNFMCKIIIKIILPHGMQSMENTFPHSLQYATALTLAKKVQFSDKRCLGTNYKNGLFLDRKNFDSN